MNFSYKAIEGDPFVVTCEASGDPKLIIYWIREDNNQRINGSILNFTSINRNDGGSYRCEVENDCARDSRVETINVSCKYVNTCRQFLKSEVPLVLSKIPTNNWCTFFKGTLNCRLFLNFVWNINICRRQTKSFTAILF